MFLVGRGSHEDDYLVMHIGFEEVELVLHPAEVALHCVQVRCCDGGQVSVYLGYEDWVTLGHINTSSEHLSHFRQIEEVQNWLICYHKS